MKIYTDNPQFAEQIIESNSEWREVSSKFKSEEIYQILLNFFRGKTIYKNNSEGNSVWKNLFIVKHAHESQFDLLIKLLREKKKLPDGLALLAGSGDKFHGFRNRAWQSLEGNIHLSAYFSPNKVMQNPSAGFLILAAVSVVQTIDLIPSLKNRAGIKWVNDVLIDGFKVSGVLSHTQSQSNILTSGVIGIGLNVEKTPEVIRDSFVPQVASLRNFVSDSKVFNQKVVLKNLLEILSKNYQKLLNGNYSQLLGFYRKRSVIIGKEVEIYSDPIEGEREKTHSGKVIEIGENLELFLEEQSKPVTKGRLVLV